MAKFVTIISRAQPGFRRAGMEHPPRRQYPAGDFTAEQLAQLKAEPLLEVIETDKSDAPADADAKAKAG